ncbi:MAG TPA: hypothetical protein VFE51_23205 [Verrucomicrobiae bacterium]|nr:hypothetical protein [Verrucomicrobiae bacterium]
MLIPGRIGVHSVIDFRATMLIAEDHAVVPAGTSESSRLFQWLVLGSAMLPTWLLLTGCCATESNSSKTEALVEPAKAGTAATLNNALDLLHDLLGDEKNLSKVLIIKEASPQLKELVKKISATAKADLKTLEAFQKTGDAPAWGHLGLPSGERATRAAISKSKEHELLHSKDSEFEFQLLLSQAEGLNYGAYLARVAAESDPNTAHASQLSAISRDLAQLRSEVLARLRTR